MVETIKRKYNFLLVGIIKAIKTFDDIFYKKPIFKRIKLLEYSVRHKKYVKMKL